VRHTRGVGVRGEHMRNKRWGYVRVKHSASNTRTSQLWHSTLEGLCVAAHTTAQRELLPTGRVLDAEGALVRALHLLACQEGARAGDVAQTRATVARLAKVRGTKAEPHLHGGNARTPHGAHVGGVHSNSLLQRKRAITKTRCARGPTTTAVHNTDPAYSPPPQPTHTPLLLTHTLSPLHAPPHCSRTGT
jgi:hypothetical protein